MELGTTTQALLAAWKPDQLDMLRQAVRATLAQPDMDVEFELWLSETFRVVLRQMRVLHYTTDRAVLANAPEVSNSPAPAPPPTLTTTGSPAPTPGASEPVAGPSFAAPPTATMSPGPTAQAPASTLVASTPPPTASTSALPMQEMEVDTPEVAIYPTHVPELHKNTPPHELVEKRKQALADLRASIKELEDHGIPEGEKIVEIEGASELLEGLYRIRAGMDDEQGREALDAMISALTTGLDMVRLRK